jgi:hypothetical protein
MNEKMLSGSAAAALAAVTLTASVFAGDKLGGIPLVWKPTELKDTGVVNLTGITGVKIQIQPFVDTRADKAKFGENQQGAVFKPVTTSGNAADFCTRNFANELRRFGFSVVQDQGDVVLGGEILEFMVIETGTYKGDVRLKLTVEKNGNTEWTGVTSGTSKRFGRSYKAENYYETISDSLLHAVQNLAQDEGFRKALAAQ